MSHDGSAATHASAVDLMYWADGRGEYTRESFSTLLANMDWDLVRALWVYDAAAGDGDAWLADALRQAPVRVRRVPMPGGSPLAALTDAIAAGTAPVLARCDNDAAYPPGWLRHSLDVLRRHPALDALGIEAMYPPSGDPSAPPAYRPADFISGLALYRRQALARHPLRPFARAFGQDDWLSARDSGWTLGWLLPALPVFRLGRLPFEPWTSVAAAYAGRGLPPAGPAYDAASTLWHWRWPPAAPSTTPATPRAPIAFLGALRVKNEARHLREVLESILPLCEQVFVFDDHSTDSTVAICQSYGDRVHVYPSPFEGLDEARDKNYLLDRVIAVRPGWVLWIDGDEVLERSGPDQLRRATLDARRTAVFSLAIAYVWDDPGRVRVDGIFGRFTRPSLFRLEGQPVERLRFRASGFGGNFHCGNVPQGLVGDVRQINVRLKHYGYMTAEQRQAKYAWYTAHDPNNTLEDNYRHLIGAPGARYAPGPPRLVAWHD
jgi:hypothetical protein